MPRPKKEQPNHAGGLYEVKITIGKTLDGKLIRKSFYSPTSKADAKAQADQWKVEREVANQLGVNFAYKHCTFSAWADRWLEIYKKPNVTVITYEGTYKRYVDLHLKPYFGNAELVNIRPVDIQQFYATKKALSESALHKIALCLNGVFETAIENDLCTKNPARRVAYTSSYIGKAKQAYTEDQYRMVCRLCRKAHPAIILSLETGLRPGELCGLRWDDISVGDKILNVNRSIAISKEPPGYIVRPPKWNSYRTVPLSRKAVNALRRLKNESAYVMPTANGEPYTPVRWTQMVKLLMSHINKDHPEIPVLSPHELRHSFGTRLRRRGIDIYTIQKVMGHKDIRVTSETYVHNEIDTLKKAMRV